MKKIYGWLDKILRINLTENTISHVSTTKYVPKFVGGRGVAAKILWDEGTLRLTAFDPQSKLVFMTGPCTGTSSPTSGRMIIAGKGPQTCPVESYVRSSIGGYWGPELKFAGYDGLILEGKSETPAYIWINDGHVEIKNAQHLWGLGAIDAQNKLSAIHGDDVRTMAIGPVGEHCSRIAIILTDGGSAAGQGGLGGVMGSKNLKAIVVKGTGTVPVARTTDLTYIRRQIWKLYYGTRDLRENRGLKRNVSRGFDIMQFGPIEKSKLYREIEIGDVKVTKPQMCYECPVARTGYYIEFLDGTHPPVTAQCEEFTGYINPELDYYGDDKPWGRVAVEWSYLQQNLGINAWETGQVGNAPTRFPDGSGGILWFKDCILEGLFTDENTGLPVSTFGSRDFAQMQAQTMVEKKGLGRLWVEGVGRMALYIQEHPEEFSLSHEEGKRVYELYQKHYPRAGRFGGYGCHHFFCACGVGLGGLVNPLAIILTITDMCDYADRHIKLTRTPGVVRYSPDAYQVADPIVKRWGLDGTVTDLTIWRQKGRAAIIEQHFGVEKDCLTFCDFVFPLIYSDYTPDSRGDPDAGAKLWSAVTGLDRTEEELMVAYERIWNLERAIICRDGRRREDDWVNSWYFTYKDIRGRYLRAEDLTKAMDEYYQERGWSLKTGIPTRNTLRALDLQDVAEELSRLTEDLS